jgi:multicomponent Na+:H+ antiporter subunit E
MRSLIILIVILVGFWASNSGLFKPLLIGLGAVSVVLVAWLTHRLSLLNHGKSAIRFSRVPGYLAWLSVQVIKSNLDVARRIWRGQSAVSPAVATIPLPPLSDAGKVLYANSITLTPGTVAMDIDEERNVILVHALSAEGIEDLKTGFMANRVAGLEG